MEATRVGNRALIAIAHIFCQDCNGALREAISLRPSERRTARSKRVSRFDDVRLEAASFSNVDLSGATIADSKLTGMRIDGVLASDLLAAYRAGR